MEIISQYIDKNKWILGSILIIGISYLYTKNNHNDIEKLAQDSGLHFQKKKVVVYAVPHMGVLYNTNSRTEVEVIIEAQGVFIPYHLEQIRLMQSRYASFNFRCNKKN